MSLLGLSRPILDVVQDAKQVATTDATVLITGESGSGKELLARMIHRESLRSHGPMLTVNCGGIPDTLLESELFGHMRGSFTDAHRDRRGLFESAHRGTVLLDEAAEMSARMQTLLLRFLENGEIQRIGSERLQTLVDVRVIAATNRNLLERVREKEFREDLYYRVNVVHLMIPPLRERREDIKILFDHFVQVLSEKNRRAPCELTPEAIACLEAYPWPGNVRELKNVAERLVLRSKDGVITPAGLPSEIVRRAAPPPAATAANAVLTAEWRATVCYERMVQGRESFWSVVYEPFMLHDLTRDTVRAVVRRGLENTRGNYRLLGELFNLPPTSYKRFLSFLQKHECHMPFQHFRALPVPPERVRRGSVPKGTISGAA